VSVNLSAWDLRDPKLLERINGAFATWGAQPDWIEFELTESALMEDPVAAMETLVRLKNLDTRLSIDDFGTGYSSLAYLQRLPVDALKIDQSSVTLTQLGRLGCDIAQGYRISRPIPAEQFSDWETHSTWH